MRQFTPEDDDVIVRMWNEGAPIREIAQALKRSVGSVSSRMYFLRKERDDLSYRMTEAGRRNIGRKPIR